MKNFNTNTKNNDEWLTPPKIIKSLGTCNFNSCGNIRETFYFEEMEQLSIPIPPIEIQKSIAAVVHCIEEAKRMITETETVMKNLFPALIQKAKTCREKKYYAENC